jgi:KDO2-lipid IV(A) lauroyltransferase
VAAHPAVVAHHVASGLARRLPRGAAEALGEAVFAASASLSPTRRAMVARHLQRVDPTLEGARLELAVRRAFASYGRYFAESFRLPSLDVRRVEADFSYEGFDHIQRARAAGTGAILTLPHLGGWEWAAYWTTQVVGVPVTAVVEPLQPRELFEFFRAYRAELGMNVVPLGPKAATEVIRAIRERHVICLLSDRDITGDGVEVEFFGERTTLPAGPATLAIRTGAPLLPSAIYFRGNHHYARIGAPLAYERRGRLREDITRITQDIAFALEELIRDAPTQWHLQQPNWPSDVAFATRAVPAT